VLRKRLTKWTPQTPGIRPSLPWGQQYLLLYPTCHRQPPTFPSAHAVELIRQSAILPHKCTHGVSMNPQCPTLHTQNSPVPAIQRQEWATIHLPPSQMNTPLQCLCIMDAAPLKRGWHGWSVHLHPPPFPSLTMYLYHLPFLSTFSSLLSSFLFFLLLPCFYPLFILTSIFLLLHIVLSHVISHMF
jgi:hypothetical protein